MFKSCKPQKVVNLAAQAGVRYSMENPLAYINSNIVGFANILENCRQHNIEHLIYASTSSVYGANTKMPFSEHDNANHPLSVYAASKKSNELMAHIHIVIFINCQLQVLDFLQFMDLGEDLIWLCLNLLKLF